MLLNSGASATLRKMGEGLSDDVTDKTLGLMFPYFLLLP